MQTIIGLRMSEEEIKLVERYAYIEHVNFSEAIRQILEQHVKDKENEL